MKISLNKIFLLILVYFICSYAFAQAAPLAPTGLTFSNVTSSSMTISWVAPTGNDVATGYKLYRNGVLIASPTTTSYTDTSLAFATPYSYTISAMDANGNASIQSAPLLAATTAVSQATLSVVLFGNGNGVITSSVGGVNCGSVCSATINTGTTVTLTATPANGSNFNGWTAAGCSGTGSCTIMVNSNTSVVASFGLSSTAQNITNGLIGWWKFSDGSGTVASDASGNSLTANLKGGVSWVPGRSGPFAISLDGNSGYVDIPSNPVLNFPTAVTFAVWIYPTKTVLYTRQGLFTNSNAQFLFDVQYNGTTAGTLDWNNVTAYIGPLNTWYYVVGTSGPAGTSIYVNGVLQASNTTAFVPFSDIPDIQFGINIYGARFGGYMNDARIYNRVLAASEVQNLYNYELSSSANAPALSQGAPSGTLAPAATTSSISVLTDQPAICRYSSQAGVDYSAMSQTFSQTGGTQQLTLISGLSPGTSYNYYVRCSNGNGVVNLTDYVISFNTPAAPADTDVIPLSRRVDWSKNSGVNFTIPSWPNGRNAKTDSGAVGDGVTDDTAAIQNCVTNTPVNTMCFIPAGIYRITGGITLSNSKGVRGAGPLTSKIMADTTVVNIFSGGGGSLGPLNAVSSGANKGSTRVFLFGPTSSFTVGGMVMIDQDNIGLTTEGTQAYESRALGQIDIVTAVGSDYIDLATPLTDNFDYTANVGVEIISNYVMNIGVESLGLGRVQTSTFSDGSNIDFNYCINCWVDNVKSQDTMNYHVELQSNYGTVVRDSWFEQTWQFNCGGNACYGTWVFQKSSDNLIENNIFHLLRHAMITEYGGTDNVFGYNYDSDPINENGLSTDYLMGDMITHGGDSHMNLWEGNTAAIIRNDNVLGPSHENTYFRNSVQVVSIPPCYTELTAIDDQVSNIQENYVGNIFGSQAALNVNNTYPGKYVGNYRFGTWGDTASGSTSWGVSLPDPRPAATMINHGNYDYIQQAIVWDPNISNHSLVNSYYRSVKPSWWDASVWPSFGPDVPTSLTGSNPAQTCYAAGQMPNCNASSNPSTYALTISTSGNGSGTVTSTSPVINCGADGTMPPCTNNVTAGSSVTLTATATSDTNSTFTGWSGACSGTGSCIVTMSAPESLTANFNSTPVNGVCGAANQTYLYSATSFGSNALCRSGSPNPSTVTFPAPGTLIHWTCVGSNNGFNSTCTAKRNSRTIVKLL